jgi:hypothetical protein
MSNKLPAEFMLKSARSTRSPGSLSGVSPSTTRAATLSALRTQATTELLSEEQAAAIPSPMPARRSSKRAASSSLSRSSSHVPVTRLRLSEPPPSLSSRSGATWAPQSSTKQQVARSFTSHPQSTQHDEAVDHGILQSSHNTSIQRQPQQENTSDNSNNESNSPSLAQNQSVSALPQVPAVHRRSRSHPTKAQPNKRIPHQTRLEDPLLQF